MKLRNKNHNKNKIFLYFLLYSIYIYIPNTVNRKRLESTVPTYHDITTKKNVDKFNLYIIKLNQDQEITLIYLHFLK